MVFKHVKDFFRLPLVRGGLAIVSLAAIMQLAFDSGRHARDLAANLRSASTVGWAFTGWFFVFVMPYHAIALLRDLRRQIRELRNALKGVAQSIRLVADAAWKILENLSS